MQVIVVQVFKSNKMGNGNMLPVTFLLPPKKTKWLSKVGEGERKAFEGERKAFEGDSNVTDLTWASARKDDALRSYCYERLGMMINIWGKMILQTQLLMMTEIGGRLTHLGWRIQLQ